MGCLCACGSGMPPLLCCALLTPRMVLLPTATLQQLSHLLPCTLAPAALQITEGGFLLLLALVPEALAAGGSTVCKVCVVTDEVC